MEWFARLRLTSIPDWSKYLFLFVLVVIGVINSSVFFDGVINGKDSLIETSLHTLGFLIPIISITYVALYIKYGDDAIIQQTKKLYIETLPSALSQIQESDLAFRPLGAEEPKSASLLRPISVEYNYKEGHIESDFKIGIWNGEKHSYLIIRLEINYRRINFNLYLSKEQIRAISKSKEENISLLNSPENTGKVLAALGHSLAGAVYAERVAQKKTEDDSPEGQTAYQFNNIMIQRELLGSEYLCIVAMKGVSSNFIWDSGERFYFCFDLMLMLRAMIDECPSILTDDVCVFDPSVVATNKKTRVSGEIMFELCVAVAGLVGIAMAIVFNPSSPLRPRFIRGLSPLAFVYAGTALAAMALLCELGLKLTQIKNRRVSGF